MIRSWLINFLLCFQHSNKNRKKQPQSIASYLNKSKNCCEVSQSSSLIEIDLDNDDEFCSSSDQITTNSTNW